MLSRHQNQICRSLRILKLSSRTLTNTHVESSSEDSAELPTTADVVIIGGGVIGCSTQYHLAKLGITNTVLLEKHQLTAGTTWHTAGLVWNLRPSDTEIELLRKSKTVMTRIEEETGINPGWINNGGLFIASTDTRLDEYKRLMTIGKAYGIESYILSPQESKELYPLMNVSDITGSLYSPGDGTVEPSGYCNGLARFSTNNGAKVFTNTTVVGTMTKQDDRGQTLVAGVRTNRGDISAHVIVNCAGVWAPSLGAQAGVNVPLVAMKHAYVNTETIPGVRGMPNIRDHDASVYLKVDGDALAVGGYEMNPLFWPKVEDEFAFSLFELDWDVFESNIAGSVNRVPAVEKAGVKSTICGPESFTPDHKPLMGESPEVRGYFLGCGFNSSGMMLSGGCGEQLSLWIRDGRPDLDMYSYDIRRFPNSMTNNFDWMKSRSHEAYAKNYSIVFPHDEPLASRNVLKGALHQVLSDQGCVYQDRHCFERPGWFSDIKDSKPKSYDYYGQYGNSLHSEDNYKDQLLNDYTFDFPKHHDTIAKECLSCRNQAAIFDMSYFGKYFISGKDAQKAVDWIFTNDLHKPEGSIVYTCMLNSKGGVEADLTVSVMNSNKGFYIAAGGGIRQHVLTHLRQQIVDNRFDCQLDDVSDNISIISVQGPKSETILQKLTKQNISESNFPINSHKELSISDGHSPVTMVTGFRVSFVGEHGYEIHVDNEHAVQVYEMISEQGKGHGLVNAGYRAMDSLSAEKGYRHWHGDVRPDDSPLECGLGFTCRRGKGVDFLGSQALENKRDLGTNRRLACFTIDNNIAIHGLETVYRNNEVVGHIRRAEYAHFLNKSIAFGYVTRGDGENIGLEYLKSGDYEIEVMGKRYAATFHQKSPFDPKGNRLRSIYA